MEIKNKVVANKRLMVANRGEIAIRIFRAATELNIRTIAVYSEEDSKSVHRFKADEAYKVGKAGDPLGAYLDWKSIIKLAIERKVDAIHPGYGFLSENPEFAEACEKNDIMFCGPTSDILKTFGDKLSAKKAAKESNILCIPGSDGPVDHVEEAVQMASSIGYPITLKALSGGGGKGIRIVETASELREAFDRARSEAQSSFGRADIYLEKMIVKPRHIEVQIVGDVSGNIVHLYERDCSVQRRHQKVVEMAPARGISDETRAELLNSAVKIGRHVDYVGVGTVEFLVDQSEKVYFLEVNPRIQVEHTVTEMVTGFDLVQASIMLAAGRKLSHPVMGIESQEDIHCQGVAIQCRITTEDPQKNFAPDVGKILAYRPAQGFGIRLDEGLGTAGAIVTPHYDSLLVKVTVHSRDLYGAVQKMRRALREFRIRGVKHNIPLLINIVSHERFLNAKVDTSFLAENPDLYAFHQPRDRATKLLKYIGNVTVNNPYALDEQTRPKSGKTPTVTNQGVMPKNRGETAKSVYDKRGVVDLVKWVKDHDKILLTDTTMRDAHQSLFATRLRNYDITNITDFYRTLGPDFFSLEVWGGATFDTCLRFLKEDPWERLAMIREKIPNTLLQMLIRGDNAVGYTNYPEWVIKDFIRLTAESGLDLFRVFDCLNNPEQMAVAIEQVKKHGAIAEAAVCYTGNLVDPENSKYTLKYFVDIALQLKSMGTDILCIKDMAGLLRPEAARILITELKERTELPIHLHTHATSGAAEATLMAASRAGCDIVDGAISAMSGLTSQPSLNALVASLDGLDVAPDIDLQSLDKLAPYWEAIRNIYQAFDPGIKSSTTSVYRHEIPGGQYSNLYDQAMKVGVSSEEFYNLTERYREVNQLLGNIVKVTPSSKVVGDMALLLQKNKLTGEEFLLTKPELDYPDSVVSFMKGHMGIPFGGFPQDLREMVLGKNPPEPEKLTVRDNDSLESTRAELATSLDRTPTDREVLSYRLYPKVFSEMVKHDRDYGDVSILPTKTFFYGLENGEEIEVELEPGKTLFLSLSGITDPNDEGFREIFFQLNGFTRVIEVMDHSIESTVVTRPKADLMSKSQIGAPMPGKVLEINTKLGDQLNKGDVVIITESMKMEYAITAKHPGRVTDITVSVGDVVEEGDLLLKLE